MARYKRQFNLRIMRGAWRLTGCRLVTWITALRGPQP
jgi:hypothetical protein